MARRRRRDGSRAGAGDAAAPPSPFRKTARCGCRAVRTIRCWRRRNSHRRAERIGERPRNDRRARRQRGEARSVLAQRRRETLRPPACDGRKRNMQANGRSEPFAFALPGQETAIRRARASVRGATHQHVRRPMRSLLRFGAFILAAIVVTTNAAFAHPLGNFTVNHLSRITVNGARIELRYVLDMAEIPTFALDRALDVHGTPSHDALARWAHDHAAAIVPQLALTVAGRSVPLAPRASAVRLVPAPAACRRCTSRRAT